MGQWREGLVRKGKGKLWNVWEDVGKVWEAASHQASHNMKISECGRVWTWKVEMVLYQEVCILFLRIIVCTCDFSLP